MASKEITVDISVAMTMEPTTAQAWLIPAPIIICLVAAGALMMVRKNVRQHAYAALIALGLLVVSTGLLLLSVVQDGPAVMTMGRWLPPYGITFAVDALGASFSFVASLLALAGAFYAVSDIDTTGRRYGFYPFLMLMMGGVIGSFLTGDIFNLYVWFEVLLISSFGLLILGSRHEQLDGALKYAFLNLVATTVFLIATGYLHAIFGTLNMADIARKAPALESTAPLLTLAALYLFAFGMKAAAFPANFWLPGSYHTPSIVVSAIFAALLTKVGIYAFLRVGFTLFPLERDIVAIVIAWVAGLTMVIGALGALAQDDIRRSFGFIVVSGIGVMFAGIAIGDATGLAGAIFYALHSMIAMMALYVLGGEIRRYAGANHLSKLGGLYAATPWLAAMAFALMLAVSGLPPFSGLWPKVLIVTSAIGVGAWWLAFAVLLTGFLTTLAMGRVFLFAFWRPTQDDTIMPEITAQDGRIGKITLFALVVPLLLVGLYPQPVMDLAYIAAEGLLNQNAYIDAVFPLVGGEVTQ